jgi:hypothetical protein
MAIDKDGRDALEDETLPPISGEDPAREGVMHALTTEPARPLTDEEEEAAKRDNDSNERVYAPASARVPKKPAPGDDKLISQNS